MGAYKSIQKVTSSEIKPGFEQDLITIDISQLVPLKTIGRLALKSPKYKQIIASINKIGIIEPPVVVPDKSQKGLYILLDGHLRVAALKSAGQTKLTCLVSTDDEAFTYNKHINRLTTIQEYRMITRAIELGVSEKDIADALNVDVENVVHKKKLLEGVCKEAVKLLQDKMVAVKVFTLLKKMKPERQVEVALLMNDSQTHSLSYVRALYAATPSEQLLNPGKPKRMVGLDPKQMERMEAEMTRLQQQYQLIEETYGDDNLDFTIAKSYLARLVNNQRIARYLLQNHPEILMQFQQIAELKTLGSVENS